MIKKRESMIDIAKGIGMIIVVLFHSEILSGIWTQFHMPLFAFLSGIFILGTQYLCFKLGNLVQIICQGKDITWLEMYGVRVEEFWLWKIVYFLCGIGIPLIIIKIKDEIYKFCGDKNKKC